MIIFRAVPKVLTIKDKINDLEKQKAYISRYGRVPTYVNTSKNRSEYYELISDELDKLRLQPQNNERIGIKPGDWVTIKRSYAVEHGRSEFGSQYRILSKTVPAKNLFTHGDSIYEWGYNPS